MAARITIKDIAKESGYSIGTVSRTLNHMPGVSAEARSAILDVVKKYNYQLNPNAKFLKQRTREGIAIMIRGRSNLLFAELVEKIQARVEEKGYDAIVYYIGEEENEVEEAIKACALRSPQGILFLGSTREYFRRAFDRIRIPCLMVTNSALGLPFSNLSSVSTDDGAAAQYAIEYLFSLGHEKIGILGGYLSDSQAAKSRYHGVQYAFYDRKKHFSYEEQYEAEYFSVEGGYRAMERLLEKMPDVTAVFVMADIMAIGAMRAARDHGLSIPEDISIIGFDGLELSAYTIPRLTTIAQDVEQIASRSVDILCQTIEELTPPVYEDLPFTLHPGESVSAPRKEKISE